MELALHLRHLTCSFLFLLVCCAAPAPSGRYDERAVSHFGYKGERALRGKQLEGAHPVTLTELGKELLEVS